MPRPPYITSAELARRAKVDEDAVTRVFDAIRGYLEEGTQVVVESFGTFSAYRVKPHRIVSPLINNGEPTESKAGLKLKLKIAPALRGRWRS